MYFLMRSGLVVGNQTDISCTSKVNLVVSIIYVFTSAVMLPLHSFLSLSIY